MASEGAELRVRGFRDSGRGRKLRKGGLKAARGKKTKSLAPPERPSPADTST